MVVARRSDRLAHFRKHPNIDVHFEPKQRRILCWRGTEGLADGKSWIVFFVARFGEAVKRGAGNSHFIEQGVAIDQSQAELIACRDFTGGVVTCLVRLSALLS